MKICKNKLFVILAAALVLQSCAPSIKLYQAATTAFSAGARKEMTVLFAARFENAPAGAMPALSEVVSSAEAANGSAVSARDLYQSSMEKLDKALSKRGPLKENDVLGNALTIKALAAWKLKKYDESESASSEAVTLFAGQQESSPRDELLAKAVPALISLDVVYDSTQHIIDLLKSKTSTAEQMSEEEALALFAEYQHYYETFIDGDGSSGRSLSGAFATIKQALAAATSGNKQAQRFALLSQLTGLKNWSDGLFNVDNVMKLSGVKSTNESVQQWIKTEWDRYDELREDLLEQLAPMLDHGTDDPIYEFWEGIL